MPDIQDYEPLWGTWHVDSLIGQGAFGHVYKIRREDFGKTYFSAIKIISIPLDSIEIRQMKNEGLTDASIRDFYHALAKDILNEITLMNELRGNSHIVSIEDHQIIPHEDGIGWDIFLRMELLQSLSDYVSDKQLSAEEVVKMGIHICRALELCAQKKIIHRDIKPDNIFLSPHGDFKLGDFGIARNIERTMSGMSRKGSYATMAPEVFRGENYGLDTDSYALGIVMYGLLNQNRVPFLPDYPQAIMPEDRDSALERRMKGEAIPPLRDIGPKLNAAILKACSYNRNDRFEAPADMRQALEAIIGIGTIPAEIKTGTEDKREALPLSDADPLHDATPRLSKNTVSTPPHPKPASKTKLIAAFSVCALLAVTAISLSIWLVLRDINASDLVGPPQTLPTNDPMSLSSDTGIPPEDTLGNTLPDGTNTSDASSPASDSSGSTPVSSGNTSASDPLSPSSASQIPSGTSLASDSFDRAAETRGFGRASQGGLWQPDTLSRLFSTDGHRAVLTIDSAGWTSRARLMDISQTDVDVTISIGVPHPLATGAVRAWVSARTAENFSGYQFRANIMPDGRIESLQFLKWLNGVETSFGATSSAILLAPGEEVSLRFRIIGSSLQGKAWKTGTSEPGTWQCVSTDTSVSGPGSVGFGVYIGASADPLPVKVTFDNFAATAR